MIRRRFAVAGAIWLSAVCACAGCGATTRPRAHSHVSTTTSPPPHLESTSLTARLQLGAFAGYSVLPPEPITSLRASLSVPEVLSRSRAGNAATWIGVSALGTTATAPFIQVGVEEERLNGTGRGRTVYFAVWSDTARHFHLTRLFPVRAGEPLDAQLKLADRRWHVSIVDPRTGVGRRFSTSDDARATFADAQIFQEDVTNGHTGRPEPYPSLSRVVFADLEVNGGPLNYRDLRSAWMTENDQALAPTGLDANAFSIRVAHPSRAGRRYLQIIQSLYRMLDSFDARLSGWSASTPHDQITADSAALAVVLSRDIALLNQATWAPSINVQIGILTSNLQALRADTQSLKNAAPAHIGGPGSAWRTQLAELDGVESVTAGDLNLPGAFPAG